MDGAGLTAVRPFFRLGPAQKRTYSGYQLHHAKWLWYIVIGTAVQPYHLIIFGSLCSQHDDRKAPGRTIIPKLFQDGQAVLVGQHNIQKHQGWIFLLHGIPEILCAGKALCRKSCGLQSVDYQFPDTFIVFNQIDHFCSPSIPDGFP